MKPNLFNQYIRCIFGKITYIFKTRSIILDKKENSINIEFYKVSSQDLKRNLPIILATFLIFIFLIYITLRLVLWLANSNLGEVKAIQYLYISFIFYFFIVCYLTLIIWSLYITMSNIIFLKTIIQFTEYQLSIKEQKFGFNCSSITIDKQELSPITKKISNNKNSKILLKYKTRLTINYKRKNIDLIAHYPPKVLNEIQEIYENYCNYNFETFYKKIVDNLNYSD
ncbi:MAG: hypothetical protein AB4372_01925 [Xenococcus sp. (in: cyanobacteria)]